jgi:rare lipoprotein A
MEESNNLEFQKLQLWLNFWKTLTRLIFILIAIVLLTFYLSDKYFKIIELEYKLNFKKQENLSYYLKYANEHRSAISTSSVSNFVSSELNDLSKDNVNNNNLKIENLTVSKDANKGLASYYADKFQGKPTASGEPFDNNALTAAHRTFPFGTMLKVTNVKTGESVVVKVNDRGPFVASKMIDLSKAAAQKIGIIKAGIGEVIIEKVIVN